MYFLQNISVTAQRSGVSISWTFSQFGWNTAATLHLSYSASNTRERIAIATE
jgi:hypothetical protein